MKKENINSVIFYWLKILSEPSFKRNDAKYFGDLFFFHQNYYYVSLYIIRSYLVTDLL